MTTKTKAAPKTAAAKTAAAKTEAAGETSFRETVTARIEDVRENVTARITDVRESVSDIRETAGRTTSAFGSAGRAYIGGLGTLGRTLIGFGREVYGETVDHVQASFRAKDLRTVAELQAAFMQNRVENSAAHAKEFIDVAREQAEASIRPIIALLDEKKAA